MCPFIASHKCDQLAGRLSSIHLSSISGLDTRYGLVDQITGVIGPDHHYTLTRPGQIAIYIGVTTIPESVFPTDIQSETTKASDAAVITTLSVYDKEYGKVNTQPPAIVHARTTVWPKGSRNGDGRHPYAPHRVERDLYTTQICLEITPSHTGLAPTSHFCPVVTVRVPTVVTPSSPPARMQLTRQA
ncbi:hypothetical protein Bbelb_128890 [Branchiostoma belcheri]|nr:hypothetical protein Bbelb_128890 [Branchiostoma belcheri]